jgi:hypothetical protein
VDFRAGGAISIFSVFLVAKRCGRSTIPPEMKHFVTATAVVMIAFALVSCCCI